MSSVTAGVCVDALEFGTWFRSDGGGPYRIDLDIVGSGCTWQADLWEKQSDGSLSHRGSFAARPKNVNGEMWAVIDPFVAGGYVAHLWLDALTPPPNASVRVWIYRESLDSRPDATEDLTYRATPPLEIKTGSTTLDPSKARIFGVGQ